MTAFGWTLVVDIKGDDGGVTLLYGGL